MTMPHNPGQAVRAALRRCWAELLEVPEDSVTDASNFFADGGDSLLAIELVSTVSDTVGAEVPIDLLFLDATFGAVAEGTVEAVSRGGASR